MNFDQHFPRPVAIEISHDAAADYLYKEIDKAELIALTQPALLQAEFTTPAGVVMKDCDFTVIKNGQFAVDIMQWAYGNPLPYYALDTLSSDNKFWWVANGRQVSPEMEKVFCDLLRMHLDPFKTI